MGSKLFPSSVDMAPTLQEYQVKTYSTYYRRAYFQQENVAYNFADSCIETNSLLGGLCGIEVSRIPKGFVVIWAQWIED